MNILTANLLLTPLYFGLPPSSISTRLVERGDPDRQRFAPAACTG